MDQLYVQAVFKRGLLSDMLFKVLLYTPICKEADNFCDNVRVARLKMLDWHRSSLDKELRVMVESTNI